MLLSAITLEGRAGIGNIHNACATIALPTDVFNFDIVPNDKGPIKKERGNLALAK
jgi:formamidase